MKKILLLLFVLFSLNASAQYYDYVILTDVNFFIVNSIANKNIRAMDAETLKKNLVREVKIKNSDGKIIGQLLVNQMGYIETYAIYDEIDESLEEEYRFGYDVNNNLVSCRVKGDGISLSHILSYENNLLASVQIDSLGVLSQYDVARDSSGRILKTTLLDLEKDIVVNKYIYHYDSDNRIEKITSEDGSKVYYEVSYSNNGAAINMPSIMESAFEHENDRIKEETQLFPTKTRNSVPRIITIRFTEKYFYKNNGLIDYVNIWGTRTGDTKETYEYGYYD